MGLCSVAGVALHHTAAIDSANDFRPLFAQMQRAVKPNDAALGTYLWMPGMLNSYAPELTPQLRWHVDDVTPENENARLTPIVANHNTIWVFNFLRDPDAAQTTAVAGLKRRVWSVDRAAAGNMSVLQFSQASTPTSAPAQVVVFADVIELSTWTMHEHAGGAALNGEPWGLPLTWRALRPISEDLAVFIHVRDCAGNLRAQQDSDLINGLRPLFTLTAGERVTETRFVVVPYMQWDGPLNFDVGVYRRSDGTRLRTREGKDAVRVPSLAKCS